VDFLADGFRLEKQGIQNIFLHTATFLPPLIIALLYPTAFIIGLSYAGICIAILIILFPALMVWNGRYHRKIVANYRVIGGKLPLVIMIIIALVIIAQGIFWRP
jgi:tyrosine-specific transport protein